MLNKKIIEEIAEQLDAGFNCYVHRGTFNLITVPNLDNYPDIQLEAWRKEQKEVTKNIENYLLIEPPNSFESFNIMQDFIESVDNIDLKNKLSEAIRKRKPFSNFKLIIDTSGDYRTKWFQFKKDKLIEMIRENLKIITNSDTDEKE
jgi:hypothetical protein